jgi:ComF family protein
VVGYQGVMAEAIQRFKYHGEIQLADSLGWLWKKISLEDLSFEVIIPVPLYPSRLRERGFNQSLVLGRILGRFLHKPVVIKGLRRTRNTVPQVELDHAQREKNVRGAFEVGDSQEIKGKSVLLVDDVFTTGATVNECTKVLKKAGAGQVYVLTLARVGVE